MSSPGNVAYREVTDANDRVYPVGETDQDILGYPRWLMVLAGAVLSMLGFFTMSYFSNIAMVFIGFPVLGGTGAGLVYGTCINMVGKWYPEKRGAKAGFVNGDSRTARYRSSSSTFSPRATTTWC